MAKLLLGILCIETYSDVVRPIRKLMDFFYIKAHGCMIRFICSTTVEKNKYRQLWNLVGFNQKY